MTFLYVSGWLIVAGMIFDVLDGRMARLTNTASKFGAELDSLCDVISFGAAPAFLLLKLGPPAGDHWLYKILFLSATFYVICTILRLARFNVETTVAEEDHRYFKGLPSPAAAGCIAAVAIMRHQISGYHGWIDLDFWGEVIAGILPFACIGVSLLMVSTVAYPHLVNQTLRGRRSFSHLVQLLILVVVILVIQEMSLVLAFWGFALTGPGRWVMKAWRQRNQMPTPALLGPSTDSPPSDEQDSVVDAPENDARSESFQDGQSSVIIADGQAEQQKPRTTERDSGVHRTG